MKDYTDLIDSLFVVDLTGLPFNDDDLDGVIRCNLHRQYFSVGNEANHFCLIGTKGGIDCFLANYRLAHTRSKNKVKEAMPLKGLMLSVS